MVGKEKCVLMFAIGYAYLLRSDVVSVMTHESKHSRKSSMWKLLGGTRHDLLVLSSLFTFQMENLHQILVLITANN
jgi:hypothetical protein